MCLHISHLACTLSVLRNHTYLVLSDEIDALVTQGAFVGYAFGIFVALVQDALRRVGWSTCLLASSYAKSMLCGNVVCITLYDL